jgi:hypothetical protein
VVPTERMDWGIDLVRVLRRMGIKNGRSWIRSILQHDRLRLSPRVRLRGMGAQSKIVICQAPTMDKERDHISPFLGWLGVVFPSGNLLSYMR